jgi:hypothetical protein
MVWTDLAQDRDRWRPLVNTVMNFGGSLKLWESLVTAELAASPQWLSSMALVIQFIS